MKRIVVFTLIFFIAAYSANIQAKNIDIKIDAVNSNQKNTNLYNFIGKKPVLSVFFYPKCSPCEKSAKTINKIYEKYKDYIFVVGISLSRDRYDIDDFIDDLHIKYPIYRINNKSQLKNAGGIFATPTAIIIDKNGKIVEKFVGARNFSFLSKKLEKYIK